MEGSLNVLPGWKDLFAAALREKYVDIKYVLNSFILIFLKVQIFRKQSFSNFKLIFLISKIAWAREIRGSRSVHLRSERSRLPEICTNSHSISKNSLQIKIYIFFVVYKLSTQMSSVCFDRTK
jgi:hypothetical protein